MREFTEAEKQELQSKIRDQQERRLRGSESESPNAKYWSLAFILFAVALNVIILLLFRSLGHEQFYLLVITLLALLDHIATHFAKQGWKKRLLKTVEWVSIVSVLAYVAYQVWIRFATKLTVTLVRG